MQTASGIFPCALIPPTPWLSYTGFAVLLAFVSSVLATTAEAARGRPYINAAKTTFVSDTGTLLRGAIISTEAGSVPSVADLQAIKNYGLNTVHCYAERRDYGYAAGAKASAVDLVVQRTRDAGLYLVITIGSGGVDTTFVSAFWNFYAPRYANETHVLYEIQNEPGNGPPVSAAVVAMNKSAYEIIRSAAPSTPVLLMSYMLFQNGAGVLTDMAALGSTVNWNNAAIAFHGYGDSGAKGTLACLKTVLAAGYPCVQTEFYLWPWGTGNFNLVDPPSLYQDVDQTGDLERLGVSWLTFLSIKRVTEDARFKSKINNGGITWTPDFGTWPVGVRSVYGNSGEPRAIVMSATTRVQAEDFDNGGQNVAYYDNATVNSGGSYRTTEGVDIQTTTDTGGGYNIGWMVAGEWMEYTVNVNDPGRYALRVRVASTLASNNLRIKLGGVDITGVWNFAATGGNQTWTTLSKTIDLPPGQQVLRFEVVSSGFNLNWIEFAPASAGPLVNGTYQVFNRGSLKAMDVVGASTSNGAKVQQWGFGGGTNQKWVFTHKGANQYTITSAQTGKALDVASNSLLSGDQISMWPTKTTTGQRWLVMETTAGYYKLVGVGSGLALEIADASTAAGGLVDVRENIGATHQQWLINADHAARFTTWTTQQFTTTAERNNAAISGATADPAKSGVSNLMRYALGLARATEPAATMPVFVTTAVSAGNGGSAANGAVMGLRFRYDPGLVDLTYRVEASADLSDWSEVVFDSRADALPALVDGWMQVDDDVKIGAGGTGGVGGASEVGRRFLRLRVLLDN